MQEHEVRGVKDLVLPQKYKKITRKEVGSFSLRFIVLIDKILLVFRDLDIFILDSLNLFFLLKNFRQILCNTILSKIGQIDP